MSKPQPKSAPPGKKRINAKAKGSRNERKTRDYFAERGYTCMKAGGSLGMFDVVGIGLFDNVLCQVKSNRPPGSEETRRIREFRTHELNRKLLVIWYDRAMPSLAMAGCDSPPISCPRNQIRPLDGGTRPVMT